MTQFTYRHLLELVDGDDELLFKLVEEKLVERHGDVVRIDVDSVLLAQTLWRRLDVDWPGIEIILRLSAQLASARREIDELRTKLKSDGPK